MMKLIKIFCIYAFFVQSLNLDAQALKVAIASSLIAPLSEIATAYEKARGIKVEIIPGASGTLTHQILNGAPFDILISADEKYCTIIQNKTGSNNSYFNLFSGKLILWSRVPIDTVNTTTSTALLKSLQNDSKLKVAIANPKIAPYGAMSRLWLLNHGFKLNEINLIQGGNVSLTNQYIATSTADFVITSYSSKHTLGNTGYWYVLDNEFDYLVNHCISHISSDSNVFSFHQFIMNPTGISVINKYDYSRQVK